MTVQHNAYTVAARLMRRGPDLEQALEQELDVQAQLVMRTMRREAPAFQSILINSIHVEKPEPLQRLIAPGVDYAEAVHDGVKAGGKGLPRFNDPEAGDVIRWLESSPYRGFGPVKPGAPRKKKLGTAARAAQELTLRDRYEGLAWHVRHKGTKGNPFVKRTHEAAAASVVSALKAAAARTLNPDGGAA